MQQKVTLISNDSLFDSLDMSGLTLSPTLYKYEYTHYYAPLQVCMH